MEQAFSQNTKLAARRKLLRLLSKAALERISELENAKSIGRPDLIEICLSQWEEYPKEVGEEVSDAAKGVIDGWCNMAR